jgi:hypothetical protein
MICFFVATGGCEYTVPDDPGNLELDWLEVQLDTFRQRDMQVRRFWTRFKFNLTFVFQGVAFRSECP